jgi:polyisoprenoid-binding protein YceI
MKNILFASLIFSCALSYTACSDAPKGDKAAIGEEQQAANAAGQIFTVDTTDSHVRFTGHGVGKNHKGTFKLSSGTVAVANNAITGGDFTININSMQLDEKEAMFKDKLGPHLLSGDFFDAAKFGTSKFEITKVGPYEKNESFPARVDLDGNNLTAKANFDIDRRQWQMNYGNDKTLKDKFISETVNIELDLKAVKRAQ